MNTTCFYFPPHSPTRGDGATHMARLVIEPCGGCAHIAYGSMRTQSIPIIKEMAKMMVTNLKHQGDISYIDARELEREISDHQGMFETIKEAEKLTGGPLVLVDKNGNPVDFVFVSIDWAHMRPMAQA